MGIIDILAHKIRLIIYGRCMGVRAIPLLQNLKRNGIPNYKA